LAFQTAGFSRAATYSVGPTRLNKTLASLPLLHPGDVVDIDSGIYPEVRRWTQGGTAAQPIRIRGVGATRPIINAAGLTVTGVLPYARAAFQIEADYIIVENMEFKNARNGDNGAGIRVTHGNHVTVRHCRITSCDMGVMCDNNSDFLIDSTEIAFNGTPQYDGYSHNLYLGGNDTTVQYCSIHDALNGQNFKTRGHFTQLLYNYIADSQDGEVGLVDSAATASPNSHAVLIGNLLISKTRRSGYNSARFIQFGQDSGGAHRGTLYFFNNSCIAGDGRIQFLSANAPDATVLAENNVFYGSDHILGTVGGGIIGSNNWFQSRASLPVTFSGSLRGADPGFVDARAHNFHLTPTSGCRDQGLSTLEYLDGNGLSHSGVPTIEYVDPMQHRPRLRDKELDLGAYGYAPP
jgi:hypothetical protein